MASSETTPITALLADWRRAHEGASERLLRRVYPELRKMAAGLLTAERRDHTLEPTALVHEAYLRLLRQRRISWHDRHHFFAIAAKLIQRLLVDHARRRLASRRWAGLFKVELTEVEDLAVERPDLVIELASALERLERLEPLQATVVRLRFFGGMTGEETARALGCSRSTVQRQWRLAKVWLYRALTSDDR